MVSDDYFVHARVCVCVHARAGRKWMKSILYIIYIHHLSCSHCILVEHRLAIYLPQMAGMLMKMTVGKLDGLA